MDFLPQGYGSFDERMHFRHDFVLSTSEAVEKYWQTLEYCYAAADPKAVVRAFPGSVVFEVMSHHFSDIYISDALISVVFYMSISICI